MTQGLSESKIIRKLAEEACQRITRKVVEALQELTNGLLSGDDSGLTNTWEEICVQIQGEYSIYWEMYEEVVMQLVASEVEQLLPYEREAVWLQTRAGEDWDAEDEESRVPDPVCTDDITEYLTSDYIYSKAADWRNRNIRTYQGDQEGDENEEEEEDEDEEKIEDSEDESEGYSE